MKFLEYANGKYNLTNYELNDVKKLSLIGKYSLNNPIYPLFELNIFNTHDNLIQLDFKSAVKVKDIYMHYLVFYHTQFISEKVIVNFLATFKNDVEKFKNTVDIKSIIKSIRT